MEVINDLSGAERKAIYYKLMYSETRKAERKRARLIARHPDWDEAKIQEEMGKPQRRGRPSKAEMQERAARIEKPSTPPLEPETVDHLARALARLLLKANES